MSSGSAKLLHLSIERAFPTYQNFSLIKCAQNVLVYRANRICDNESVAIKLIASFDEQLRRWRGPTRGLTQTLMLHYETLKLADQRNINHFVKPVEIRIVKLVNEIAESTAKEPKSNENKFDFFIQLHNDHSFKSWALITDWSEGLTVSTLSSIIAYSEWISVERNAADCSAILLGAQCDSQRTDSKARFEFEQHSL